MIKTCCRPFDRLLCESGNKGVSIIPRIQFGERFFELQFRVFDMHVSEYLCKADSKSGVNKFDGVRDEKGHPIPIALTTSIVILYCPSCGRNLTEIINSNIKEFDVMAKESKLYFEK